MTALSQQLIPVARLLKTLAQKDHEEGTATLFIPPGESRTVFTQEMRRFDVDTYFAELAIDPQFQKTAVRVAQYMKNSALVHVSAAKFIATEQRGLLSARGEETGVAFAELTTLVGMAKRAYDLFAMCSQPLDPNQLPLNGSFHVGCRLAWRKGDHSLLPVLRSMTCNTRDLGEREVTSDA